MIPSLDGGFGGAALSSAVLVTTVFFLVLHTATAVLLIRALPELWREWDPGEMRELEPVMRSDALPTVSVVVSGEADPTWTTASVRELLALEYPRHEVVLVHDAASSGLLDRLVAEFELYPVPPAVLVNVPTGPVRGYYRSRRHGKLFVLDKAHVGRADDLNAALNASRFPYLLVIDVGTRLRRGALLRLMRPFLLGHRIGAVRATARVLAARSGVDRLPLRPARTSSWTAGVQAVETLLQRVYVQLGWNAIGGQPAARGGLVLHRRDHLLAVDGYRSGPLDPDRDLELRLREHLRAERLSDAIPSIADDVAWTAAARSATQHREHVGQVDVLRSHGAALLTTRHGTGRLLASLHLLAAVVVAPVMELFAYLLLLLVLLDRGADARSVLLLLVAVPGYAVLLSWWAIALEAVARPGSTPSDTMRLVPFAVVAQLGHRQWVAWSRCRALWESLRHATEGGVEQHGVGQPAEAVTAGDHASLR